ncbi:serine/threonine-protein kinase [Flindersiella endophytica]
MLVDRYTVVRQLGAGAQGTVWLARDEKLRREVAVKQVSHTDQRFGEAAEIARQRAMREGRIAARLNHPNAVAVYDVAVHDGDPWLVMEYVRSRTLAEVVREQGGISPKQAAALGAQIAGALAEAHRLEIVHRDVKPSNILITEDGRAKITDFGIARGNDDATLTATGLVTGTPAYFAPELARGITGPTSATDVWSLGATLYYAVEGMPPFGTDDNPLVLLGRIASQEVQRPVHAGELEHVLLRMLSRDPIMRPTMRQTRAMLSTIAGTISNVPVLIAEPNTEENDAITDAPDKTKVVEQPVVANSPEPDAAGLAGVAEAGTGAGGADAAAELDAGSAEAGTRAGEAEPDSAEAGADDDGTDGAPELEADGPVDADADAAGTDAGAAADDADDAAELDAGSAQADADAGDEAGGPGPAAGDDADVGGAAAGAAEPSSAGEAELGAASDEAAGDSANIDTGDGEDAARPGVAATGGSTARYSESSDKPWSTDQAWERDEWLFGSSDVRRSAPAGEQPSVSEAPAEPAERYETLAPAAPPGGLDLGSDQYDDQPLPDPRRGRLRKRGIVLIAACAFMLAVAGLGSYLLLGNRDRDLNAGPTETTQNTPVEPKETAKAKKPQPSEQPTNKQTPTKEPKPTTPPATPPGSPMRADAMTARVSDYYALLPNRQQEAWNWLGPKLQAQGFRSYTTWWSSVRSVSVSNLRANPSSKTVTGTVRFVMNSGRTSSERHTLGLIETADGKGLLVNTDNRF